MATPAPTRVRYRVLGLACALSMITYLDRVCFGAAAPRLIAELSLDGIADLKWAFTAFAIAYAVFEVPAGWLGDRLGPRGTLIRIVAWWSVFTALTGQVGLQVGGVVLGGLGTLTVLRFLFGAGEAGAYPNIARALHNWFPARQRAMAQGWVWMAGRLMGGLTPLVWAVLVSGTQFTTPLTTWRGAFALFGLVGLAWCLVFAIDFRNRPDEHPGVNAPERALIGPGDEAAAGHSGVPWRALLTSRTLQALCVMYFGMAFGWYFHITYLPSYLADRYGLEETSVMAAVYKGGPLWVGAAGCLGGGFLADWLGRMTGNRGRGRRLLGATALAACAGCWLLVPAAPDAHSFFLLTSAAAFFNDLTMGSAWATCQDIGRRHAGVTAACMNTVGTIGAAVAGWLTGTLVERAIALRPGDTLAGFDDAFLTYAVAYGVAAACWLAIDPARPVADDRAVL